MVFPDEQRDDVFLTVDCLLRRFSQCIVESFVRLVVGQCFNDIRHGNFKDNVHTTF